MRATTLLRYILDQKHTRVTGFELTPDELVVDVAPSFRRPRCGCCGGKCSVGYDARERCWRHLDFAGMRVELRYRLRRVNCRRCGVMTEMVPWAEHASWFTRDFEDSVALLAQKVDKTTIRELMQIGWETVGNIIERVWARRRRDDLLEGLTHIGIDEISYKRHHQYLTLVVDHLRGRVVWMGVGRSANTLRDFFDQLGQERAEKLELISIDMHAGYIEAVCERTKNAEMVFDRFHVQRLAHDALDAVRREQVRELRGTDEGKAIKKTRWALQKNPWNLTPAEHGKVSTVQTTNRSLYRGYLLKETLCGALDRRQPNVARRMIGDWIAWAQRSRLEPFKKLARTVQKHLDGIVAYVRTRLSNGLVEGMNGKIRTITKRSYGFRDPSSLIAMIYLCCTGLLLVPVRHFPNVRQ